MDDYLFIRIKREFFKLTFSDIMYIESWKNYIQIVTIKNKFMVKMAIGRVEKILPKQHFCRIHRGYIVALKAITGFNKNIVHIQSKDFPISDRYKSALLNRFVTLQDRRSKRSTNQIENGNGLADDLNLSEFYPYLK
jgi:DNA-binding LytR/AlgR family response regulator